MFQPIQPELHAIPQYSVIQQPSLALQHAICCFYEFQLAPDAPSMLPGILDGAIDILFNMNGDAHDCFILASPKRRQAFHFRANTGYFGFRILPFQHAFHFEASMTEIHTYTQLPLFDVIPELRPIYEQLLLCRTINERIELLEQQFTTSKHADAKASIIVSSCTQFALTSKVPLQVQHLENYSGYSSRYLRLCFQNELGFSPKHFLDILYFQQTLKELLYGQFQLDTHLERHGIYDDSHFYKKFKRTFSMTPRDYVVHVQQYTKKAALI